MIETEPENVPAADGAKVTEKASDCPAASEVDAVKPDTVNPCGTLILVMFTLELLLFVTLAACALVLVTTTVPKFMDAGLTEICSAVGDEDPVAECNFGTLAALTATKTTTQKYFLRHRGPRSFIGGTSTG